MLLLLFMEMLTVGNNALLRGRREPSRGRVFDCYWVWITIHNLGAGYGGGLEWRE